MSRHSDAGGRREGETIIGYSTGTNIEPTVHYIYMPFCVVEPK